MPSNRDNLLKAAVTSQIVNLISLMIRRTIDEGEIDNRRYIGTNVIGNFMKEQIISHQKNLKTNQDIWF